MELTYTQHGDYLLPDLTLGEMPPLGKYAQLRLQYLKTEKRPLYDMLMGNGQLVPHLASVQKQASEQVRRTVRRLAEKQNVTEELKSRNQMMWVGMMNNIKHSAEESVLHDLIYR